jgi:RNA polymerase sigma-70 factor (ECF subfamily)
VRARAPRRDRPYPFVRFVRDHQSLVYNLAYRILGDEMPALIATQDAFLRAFPAFQEHRRKASELWLIGLVVEVCQERMSLLTQLEYDSGDTPPEDNMPESRTALTRRPPVCEEAQALLNTLPPEERVTVVLSDIQGLSCKEIAHVTHVPTHLIRSRLDRGRTRLRNALLARGGHVPTG